MLRLERRVLLVSKNFRIKNGYIMTKNKLKQGAISPVNRMEFLNSCPLPLHSTNKGSDLYVLYTKHRLFTFKN